MPMSQKITTPITSYWSTACLGRYKKALSISSVFLLLGEWYVNSSMPHTEISILMAGSQDSNFHFNSAKRHLLYRKLHLTIMSRRKPFFSEHTKFLHENKRSLPLHEQLYSEFLKWKIALSHALCVWMQYHFWNPQVGAELSKVKSYLQSNPLVLM